MVICTKCGNELGSFGGNRHCKGQLEKGHFEPEKPLGSALPKDQIQVPQFSQKMQMHLQKKERL
jgi:hypothetical protein